MTMEPEVWTVTVYRHSSNAAYTFGPFTSFEDAYRFAAREFTTGDFGEPEYALVNPPALFGTGRERSVTQ